MGAILTRPASHLIMDQAMLLPEGRDVASHWASRHINGNPALRWVIGKYVEADNPNSNMQQWRLGDLEASQDTVTYSPMNILHRPHHVVGAFVGTELLYPKEEVAQQSNPFIEAVGAFWRYYFPSELAVVEQAHNEGSLFFSMECIGETMTFISPDGKSESFEYAGAHSDTYGHWGKDPENIRQIDNPHFLGGALIFPPKSPGWSGARVEELSEMIDRNQAEAEEAYEMFKERAPHLDAQVWEELMLSVMAKAKGLLQ